MTDYNKLSSEAFEKFKGHFKTNDGWTALKNDFQGIESWEKLTTESPIKIIKATGTLKCSAEKMFNKIWNQTYEEKKKGDDSLLEDTILEKIDDNTLIKYQGYKATWPVSNRDFLFLRSKFEENGAIYQVDVSIEHSSKSVEQTSKNGYVRAKLIVSGYVYVPKGNNECEATHIVLMDPSGNVPTILVNSNTSKIAKKIKEFQDISSTL
eukprot:TRINITY_DN418_c0_g1_i1.p2 TRINITY_DN418_c0_g1~~TRINITY_DN418_c0_g1_i1.p2  ORF type:complete len:225 (+),score=78.64 TRINITY_DN418_c0_g1_i1:49-675(+)